ncbi:bifunctional lysylphosphatidylglycerol flippase/synthetase MprF [Alloscardovia macacae]|uniref:Phosphatidylglycerol lysyltransferase C-terminal domain-containing protein n=1 Tax=Alloscardovia macacae TaxID=1160091 RepID=A0A261F547_9BIFI|nr:DUF2156 domain-containing protein [Alloscardovia macacae]OZG54234.1 hypothetical protein ALMA_0695 [Alloscardovia macacae]
MHHSQKTSRDLGQSVRVILRDLLRFFERRPWTVGFAVAFFLVNTLWRILWDGGTLARYGIVKVGSRFPGSLFEATYVSLGGYGWARSLGTLIIVNTMAELIFGTAAILLLFGTAERLLGIAQSFAAAVVSTVIGISSALGVYFALYSGTLRWASLQSATLRYGIGVAVIGVFLASTARMSTLWQRHISIITYAAIGMLILYRGEVKDYAFLFSAFVGQMYGFMISSADVSRLTVRYTYIGAVERRRIIASVYMIFAFGPVISVLSPLRVGPLSVLGTLMSSDYVSFPGQRLCTNDALRADCLVAHRALGAAGVSATILSIALLLVMVTIAWGLFHGRRAAAWASIVMSTFLAALTASFYVFLPLEKSSYYDIPLRDRLRFVFFHGGMTEFTLIVLAMASLIIMILANLPSFPYRMSRWNALAGVSGIVLAGGVLASVCGWIIFSKLTDFSGGSFHVYPLEAVMGVATYLVPMGFLRQTWSFKDTKLYTPTELAILNTAGPVFWIFVCAVLLWWFRSAYMNGHSQSERLNAIITQGGNSLSFMSTWEGNQYWFSADGQNAIAYRVLFNVAIALTGVCGPSANAEKALAGFSTFCQERGWTPVLYSVHDDERSILESWGWNSLDVGTEMIIRPREWSPTGKKWQDIRTALNKAKREGLRDILTTYEQMPAPVREQIMDISEEWSEEKALPEMKFTLGGVEELMDPRVQILYAIDEFGRVQAVTSWLPTYRDGVVVGWTLDFMRHRSDSMKGVMEFLIARMAERLHDECEDDESENNEGSSIEFLSLSAAPLSGVEIHEGQSELLSHVLQFVAKILEPAYGFSSLFFFKKKFQPEEQHVFIVYPDSSKLAQISLAISHAYLPQLGAKDLLNLMKTLRG